MAAFDQLLEQTQDWLSRFILRVVGDTHLADDILQDAYMLIYRKLRWLHNPGLYRYWAYRLAAREAFRQLRKERRWRGPELDEQELPRGGPDPASSVAAADIAELLTKKIEELPPNSRAVVSLHYIEQLTIGEIGAVLDLPVGTVKSRLAYALKLLRRNMPKEPS